jgi:hypoxanthine phosphoribosyltransferase
LTFKLSKTYEEIKRSIQRTASKINHDYKDKDTPIFLGILNGAFMYMAELLLNIDFVCECSFVKIASYSGTSSKDVKELIGLSNSLNGRNVIIVEDIVDTGKTIHYLLNILKKYEPASVAVACVFFKEEVYHFDYLINYPSMKISSKFIVGFGLDYNQIGRNLKDLYELDTSS